MSVRLHNHTNKSLLDSILTVDQMVKFCKTNNQTAIALTDHGCMFEMVNFYKACIKENIKPIIGCEIYEVDNMLEKNDTKEYKQPRYHLVLLVKNHAGLLNLFKIVSAGYTIGFYTKPRIDLNYIEENHLGEGIICLTACQIGRLSAGLVHDVDMKPYWDKLNQIFDYCAVELQSHDTDSQYEANLKIWEFIKKYNCPYTITTDSHMAAKEDLDAHSIFVAIGEDREVGETYKDCYLQTDEEIHNILDNYLGREIVNSGLQESNKIAEMVELVDIGLTNENQMPKINHPDEFSSNDEYLKYLINKDFDKRFDNLSDVEKEKRKQRLEMEYPILQKVNYVDYFIMLYMLAQKADERGIPRGYSRGSGANCECLYMLGVTQIDSVKWDLDFSRFANLGRTSMADFDWDISRRRRREMVDISCELFGKDKVAPICTFNTLSTKVAIRDIGKVLDERGIYVLPYKLRDEVSKMIPTIKTINDLGEEEDKDVLLKEVLFKNEKLKRTYEQYPKWFDYVMKLEGLPKSLSRHAAGTIISPRPIIEYCPLCLDSDGNIMIQLEMHNAMDDLKLVKMDFLGLETLDIVDDTLKMINKTWKDFDINHLDLNDKKVFDNIYRQGHTIGIFQMESSEATQMCMNAETDNIEDVIAINAFDRPGTKEGFPEYVNNKKYPEQVKVLHEDLKQIFNKTYFVLLYQEQALQMFRYAGFPEDQVDNARRAIGKKKKDVMASLKDKFIDGYDNDETNEHILGLKRQHWNQEQCNGIWDLMLKQAEYCFNKGHSTAYGLLSYLTAYLKYYCPLEFMTACLISKTGDVSRTSVFINECHRLGIKVLPPNINDSKENYTPRKQTNDILFGILPIKGIGKSVTRVIIDNQPYQSFTDFFNKTKNSGKIDKSTIIALIKSGAFTMNNKEQYLLKYASKIFNDGYNDEKFEDRKSYPSVKELKEIWGIDTDKIKNKQVRIDLFNQKRKQKFDSEQFMRQEKKKLARQKSIQEFKDKYMQDPSMWEFETLSMFLTNNPFEKAYTLVRPFANVPDGQKATVIGTIINIQRKKDKNNNAFCYLTLYTPFEILESICWSSKYNLYQELLKKGNNLAILGRKGEDKLFVEAIKPFEQWKKDKGVA